MNSKLAAGTLLIVSLCACIRSSTAEGRSRVRVQISDAYGKRIPASAIEMETDGQAQKLSDGETISMEYGHHSLRVSVAGFSDAIESVVINQPEQVIAIAMKLGIMETAPPHCSISGHVTADTATLRASLVQVFGSYRADVPVTKGSFEFRDLECGDYLVVVVFEKECVAAKLFRATPGVGRVEIGDNHTPSDTCLSPRP